MKVEILLEKGETLEEAEELLYKAMQHHQAGHEHRSSFQQPSAREVFNKIIKEHDKTWKAMMKDIEKTIEEDVFR